MLLRDNVYESLRSDILTCHFAPGDDMREQDLAERYAVSRQPVREALLRLEREHLVTVQPRQGYRVNPISLATRATSCASAWRWSPPASRRRSSMPPTPC